MALLELAERCEAAGGPDRELDIEIVVAIDWREPDWEEGERTASEMAERHGIAWLTSRSVEGFNSTWRHLPRFTASLDAAMTLVPEGFCGQVQFGKHLGAWVAPVTEENPADFNVAAAAALALCAAALRARAASADTHPEGGDAKQAPFMGSAVGNAETPNLSHSEGE